MFLQKYRVLFSLALVTLAATLFTLPLQAHHSFIIYDGNQYTTYKGVMTRDIFNAGSHASFEFEVTDASGEKTVWKAESQATRIWPEGRPTFIEVSAIGEEVTVTGWPLRSGQPVLWLHTMKNEQTGVGFSVDNRIVQGASQFTFGEGELFPEEAANLPEFDSEGRRTRTEDGLLTRFGVNLLQEMTGKELDERQQFDEFE